jgi:Ni/Co efflux regulator RcnB
MEMCVCENICEKCSDHFTKRQISIMARKKKAPAGHTGKTSAGNVRDVKIERIDQVTIYKRGKTYSLYYRENGKTVRQRIDGNLAVARATATKVAAALRETVPRRWDLIGPAQES